ncbi:hypothetical protein [Paenarthrobacter nicotinovorans]|uniref:hypothetical protein n=1 Tax=Paenarthrobacter nicotinovorans TaxID=29320 RepID=UPI0007E6273B|nr:hypothetical protein [Paenarthrobacter nicotinovorans]
MGSMKVDLVTVELASGDVHENLRITVGDRLRLEEVGRTNGWKVGHSDSTHLVEQQAFLAYAVLKRLGLYIGGFETFRNTDVVDLQIQNGAAELGDPTPAVAGID